MRNIRIACARIPDFALALQLKDGLFPSCEPVALTANSSGAAAIEMCSEAAGKYGVEPGMTAVQGHALCPELRITTGDPNAEALASKEIVRRLQDISPFVEEETPGIYFLDASGLIRLYKNERGLSQRIIAALRNRGYPVTVGVGQNRTVARVAAEISRPFTFTIIPSGTERRFLGSQTIEHLRPSAETRWRLHALGLRTAEQIAAIPRNDLIACLGPEAIELLPRARGHDPGHFIPEAPAESRAETLAFAVPLTGWQAVRQHVEQILQRLLDRLKNENLACSQVLITLTLENRTIRSLALKVEGPSQSMGIFLRQFEHEAQKSPLNAEITGIALTIPAPTAASAKQTDLSAVRATRRATEVQASETFSKSQLYIATRRSEWLPEHDSPLVTFPSPAGKRLPKSQRTTTYVYPAYARRSIAGLRLFTPPRKLQVAAVASRPRTLQVEHHDETVRHCQGPWALSGGWWHTGFDRYYYEVETEPQHRYLLYLDRLTARWFLQGIFD